MKVQLLAEDESVALRFMVTGLPEVGSHGWLRAAVAEFLGMPDTPRPVIINEAIEIARRYSTPESIVFINGVLDSIARELEKQPAANS